jgi:hypothetical protein
MHASHASHISTDPCIFLNDLQNGQLLADDIIKAVEADLLKAPGG